MAKAPKTKNKLSLDEARRALYIDFEGNKDAVPILLGWTRKAKVRGEASVHQVVLDPRFRPLAEADELEIRPLEEAVDFVVRMAESKGRRIVAWSEHDLDIVREHCSPGLADRFHARYGNARDFAERWRNKCHEGAKPPTNRLPDYLDLIRYPLPENAGPDKAGDSITALAKALAAGKSWGTLTDSQRRRWRDLLDHNRHDCVGMKRVCLIAADEIDTGAPGSITSRPSTPTATLVGRTH